MAKISFGLLIVSIAVIIAVGRGNFAYLDDTETSTTNTCAAGTLELLVTGGGNPEPTHYTLGPLVPGDSGNITYQLTNAGNLEGFLDLNDVVVTNDGATFTLSEEVVDPYNDGNLGAALQITVSVDGTIIYSGSMDAFTGDHNSSTLLASGDTVITVIDWQLPSEAGDEIDGDTVSFSITFDLQYQP